MKIPLLRFSNRNNKINKNNQYQSNYCPVIENCRCLFD